MKREINNSQLFNSLLKGYEIRYSDMIQYLIESNKNYIPFCTFEVSDVQVHREKKHTDLWIEGKRKDEQVPLPIVIMENKLKSIPEVHQLEEYTKKILKDFVGFYKKALRIERGVSRIHNETIFNDLTFISKIHDIAFFILSPLGDEKFDFEVKHPLKSQLDDKLKKLHEKKNKQGKIGTYTRIDEKIMQLESAVANNSIRICWKPKSYLELGEDINERITSKYSNVYILRDTGEAEVKKNRQQIYKEELIADFSSLLISFGGLAEIMKDDLQQLTISEMYSPNNEFNDLGLGVLYKKYRASLCANLLFSNYNLRYNEKPAFYGDWKMGKIDVGAVIIKHDYSTLGKNGLFEIFKKINGEAAIVIQCEKYVLKKGIVFRYEESRDSDEFLEQQYGSWFNDVWNGEVFFTKSRKDGDPPTKYHTYRINEPYKFYYSKVDLPPLTMISEIVDFMIEKVYSFEESTASSLDHFKKKIS